MYFLLTIIPKFYWDNLFRKILFANSLVAQWLGLSPFTPRTGVRSLVRKLRYIHTSKVKGLFYCSYNAHNEQKEKLSFRTV